MKRLNLFQTARLSALIATLTLLPIGCSALRDSTSSVAQKLKLPSKEEKQAKLKAGPTKVLTDATAIALELPESDLQAQSKFRSRFKELTDAHRTVAAELLVSRHLDHTYEVLIQTDAPDSTNLALAAAYDRVIGNERGWHALLSVPPSEAVMAYRNDRKQFSGAVANGNFKATQQIDLAKSAQATGFEVLTVDALYQVGIGQLLRLENQQAAASFAQCAKLAANRHGMVGANAWLLSGESSRRAGDYAASGQSWNRAIELACEQIRTRNVTDPVFWDRAIHVHPVGNSWPDVIADTIRHVGSGPASALRTEVIRQLAFEQTSSRSAAPELLLEAALGSWRESRNETEKALIHLKKAETRATGPMGDWLRIAQAPLLVSLGQNGTATTLLAPIISREDQAPTTLAAMAKLGVIKLKSQSPQHGVRLLQESAGPGAAVDWPGRSSAAADLALGLLMIGDNVAGLQQLTEVQAMFEREGEVELLAKSLWNQQKYLEHSDAKKAEIAAVSVRLDSMRL